MEQALYLGLAQGHGYGWGVCSRYLIAETAGLVHTEMIGVGQSGTLPGPIFKALSNISLETDFPAQGTSNYGYTFFENELTPLSAENGDRYDIIFAGSTWCLDRLRAKGIDNCAVLLQGIDPKLFFPQPSRINGDSFIVFSGGKFELRKSQDLVIKAMAIMQQKYSDVDLVAAWHNPWPMAIDTMGFSPHIQYKRHCEDQSQLYRQICADNGMDTQRLTILPSTPYTELASIYAATDVGLFPNRCEGGTNLVMMEYMGCGRSVIATNGSGHRDVVSSDNALLLDTLKPFTLLTDQDELLAQWDEPDVDEIVAHLEYAYHNRDKVSLLGQKAGRDLSHLTWAKTAQTLLQQIF